MILFLKLKCGVSCIEKVEITTNEVMNDKVDGVNPDDSISNVGSRYSSKISTCISVSSARVIAKSKKATLFAQEQMIKRKKEQLKLKAILEKLFEKSK